MINQVHQAYRVSNGPNRVTIDFFNLLLLLLLLISQAQANNKISR